MSEVEILKEVIPSIFFSLICGAVIGLERERKKKAAGFKTIMLIILGSSLFTVLALMMHRMFPQSDPSRIVSYIISGIGFLGAGAIFRPTSDKVGGLTTASVIWVSAGIGIMIGLGYCWTATAISAIVVSTLTVVSYFEERFFPRG